MMTLVKNFHRLPSIELDVSRKLQDPEYRERFFLSETSAEIARQLIALRKRRGLSQAELAEKANTHQPAVSRAEQADYHNWSFSALRNLTNAMGGRLRVIIEAWEDVAAEYTRTDSSDFARELFGRPQEGIPGLWTRDAKGARAGNFLAQSGAIHESALGHFPTKWKPGHLKKVLKTNDLERRSNSIRSKSALVDFASGDENRNRSHLGLLSQSLRPSEGLGAQLAN